MELRKYTDEAVVNFEHDRIYIQEERLSPFNKPRGFWVSVEGPDDWKSWCIEEEFWLHRLYNEQIILLEESANILYLNTVEEMEAFQEKYGVVEKREIGGARNKTHYHSWNEISIDWHRVVEDYDGLIIPIYQWQARNTMNWYYGWDAASGCIWNGKAIKSVTRKLQELPGELFRSVRSLDLGDLTEIKEITA